MKEGGKKTPPQASNAILDPSLKVWFKNRGMDTIFLSPGDFNELKSFQASEESPTTFPIKQHFLSFFILITTSEQSK